MIQNKGVREAMRDHYMLEEELSQLRSINSFIIRN